MKKLSSFNKIFELKREKFDKVRKCGIETIWSEQIKIQLGKSEISSSHGCKEGMVLQEQIKKIRNN